MKSKSKQQKVAELLQSLQVGDSFVIEDFVKEHWGSYDYYIRRSFNVFLSKAKQPYQTCGVKVREFKCTEGVITRTL